MSEDITQPLPNDTLRLILARLDSIDGRLDGIDTRLDGLDTRLTSLEEKVDRRLQETRPIWEQVLVRLDAVEAGLSETRSEMRQGFDKLRIDMEDSLRKVERKIEILNDNFLDIRADQRNMDRRLVKLESEPAQ